MITNTQLLNDPEETQRQILDGRIIDVWTAIPGIITLVNFTQMTCEVQPAVQAIQYDQNGKGSVVSLPLLLDVPIVFPKGGGFCMTFPLEIGDEVLVIISSRCIDNWWKLGGVQSAAEARMHDLSDGFAIPGPYSLPNVIPSISSTKVQIRNTAGTVVLSIGTKFEMMNVATSLTSVLTNLQSTLSTFMATLAAFSGGASPVTQAMLQAPAAAAQTSLATVLTEIGALLE